MRKPPIGVDARDRDRDRDADLAALLARMTIEEKAGQLTLYADATRPHDAGANPETAEPTPEALRRAIADGHVGALFNAVGAAGARQLQQIAVERSRLGIPLVFAADVIHGLRTVFPVPLAEASAFDADLAERTARAAAVEASACGVHWVFAPMVDVARDQRWGRVVEGAGEDPLLGSVLAAARVRGFQGGDLARADSVLATLKHFAGYGAVAGGREYAGVDIAESVLRDVHLPPFQAGIEAGALAVMTAFNDVLGVPCTANPRLLDAILRGEWGYAGLVVSDYTSDAELVAHGVAADGRDAARLALLAGCDVSMHSGLYRAHLPALVAGGEVPLAVVDRAVLRVLRVKHALGLFADPYRSLDPTREAAALRRPETLALAREAARRSVVLLKNDAGVLPLAPAGQRIALVGPFGADHEHLAGPWSLWAEAGDGVGLAQGLRAALADPRSLDVVAGCGIDAALPGGIDAAVAAARRADVVLLALGEGARMSGEAASRPEIGLPAAQQALAEAVAAVGKPVVVVLRHGRALALHGAVRAAQAIVAGWFLGSETGHALADVLFGAHAPSGRLPVSFPLASGQQPYHYNHTSTGRPQPRPGDDAPFKARYVGIDDAALYPFGHGLGYGDIAYGATEVDAPTLAWDGRVTVACTLTNRGARAQREVAQLYLRQRVAPTTRPVRELRGWQALEIAAGECVTARFVVGRDDLAFVRADGHRVADPGWFELTIAPDAQSGTAVAVRLEAAR